MVESTLWQNRKMWASLDCRWWVIEHWMISSDDFICVSAWWFVFFLLTVENPSLKKVRCLAFNETQCTTTFLHSMDKKYLVEMFTHLYCHHRPHFDHLKENVNDWIAQHEVRCVRREKHHKLTKMREKDRWSLSPSKQRWSDLLIIWSERRREGSQTLICKNW